MAFIGAFFRAFFRWLLTINAVWGLMIIIAFVLTVYQHFNPTTDSTPAGLWKDGENKLTIKVFDKDGKATPSDFTIGRVNGALTILAGAKKAVGDKPYLISVEDQGFVKVKWDAETYGKYELEVNGAPAAKGNLVTLQALTDSAMEYAKKAFELGLGLVSTMVLFLGIMKIGEDAGIVQFVARVMRPIIRWVFPDIPDGHPASGAILMNFTTGMLGLGNAATPFGLKAMMELQKLNRVKNVASNSMVVLLAWNTSGFAILPTSLLAIRKSANCADPMQIIGPCMLGGLCSTVAAILFAKALCRLPMFSYDAAAAEEPEESPEATAQAQSSADKKEAADPAKQEQETAPTASSDDKKKGA